MHCHRGIERGCGGFSLLIVIDWNGLLCLSARSLKAVRAATSDSGLPLAVEEGF